ncbi:MAG: AAA family ATPase [Solimonas sp.]
MPLLHLLAGPNGSGKTTFHENVLAPVTGLPFINADVIARQLWPNSQHDRSYEAAKLAERQREEMIAQRRSFIAETVFSHPSKLELIRQAQAAGFLVIVHAILVPLELSVRRVAARVKHGGHDVPVRKQHERFERLWPLIADALRMADEGYVYDNSLSAAPYRTVAHFERGQIVGKPDWPKWSALGKLLP